VVELDAGHVHEELRDRCCARRLPELAIDLARLLLASGDQLFTEFTPSEGDDRRTARKEYGSRARSRRACRTAVLVHGAARITKRRCGQEQRVASGWTWRRSRCDRAPRLPGSRRRTACPSASDSFWAMMRPGTSVVRWRKRITIRTGRGRIVLRERRNRAKRKRQNQQAIDRIPVVSSAPVIA